MLKPCTDRLFRLLDYWLCEYDKCEQCEAHYGFVLLPTPPLRQVILKKPIPNLRRFKSLAAPVGNFPKHPFHLINTYVLDPWKK